MKTCPLFARLALLTVIAVSPIETLAADVLQNVPQDALGFLVVKDLAATDAKVDQLLKTLHAEYPAPLVFLKAVTGIDEGLNPQGQFLLAVLPSGDGDGAAPQFAVWLPVADYDRMLQALEATPGERISVVRVAEEDLLIARRGDWALVMDPDQRERMEKLLADEPNPPTTIARWKDWIDANDVAAVLLPDGVRTVLKWAAKGPSAGPDAEEAVDDLFGNAEDVDDPFAAAEEAEQLSNGIYGPLHAVVYKWIGRSPELHVWLKQMEAIGIAARLDDKGNALASARLRSSADIPIQVLGPELVPPPSLYQPGDFVLHGAGHLPPAITKLAAATYARTIINELKNAEQVAVDDDRADRFVETFQSAASDIGSWSVASPLGKKSDGVYTNNFLALRVADAKSFIEHADDVVQLWNKVHRDADSGTRMVFDIEETKIGARAATQYSLDVAAIDGMPAIPEIRQLMERFFGPGGKFRVWLVPIDDHSVLLAAATLEQITKGLQLIDRKLPAGWDHPELAAAHSLLPEKSDVRLFISPHGHGRWRRREADATNGTVFGPRRKEFPDSPPVAVAGGVRDNEVWLDAAIPADTIKSAGKLYEK